LGELARERGVLRPSDALAVGADASYLPHLARRGVLERVGRGLYSLPDSENATGLRSVVEVAVHSPRAVICLLTALGIHEIGTQLPPAVWVAIPSHGRYPTISTVVIEVIQMVPRLLHLGVQERVIEGVPVSITNAEKTVVDCFRYRSRVGIDVAIEALKDGMQTGLLDANRLIEFAEASGEWSVMRPYIEALS
jgi:predicted transcriptional regulator of viral defense system